MRSTVVAIGLALLGASGHAQQPSSRFSSGVDLVIVDALVMDGRRPVIGLRANDFELLDDGVPQEIRIIEAGSLPINMVLALDTSRSVAGRRLDNLREAGRAIMGKLGESDRGAVLAFSHHLQMRTELTGDRAQLARVFDALSASGSTALRDGAYTAMSLADATRGRWLLLIFSDGVDTASFLTERRVVEAARRSNVVVYPLALRARVPRQAHAPPLDTGFLEALARETGGRLTFADGDDDIGDAFARIFDEFSRRYLLGYVPTNVGLPGWHALEVKLRNRRGVVSARRGYFAR
jgi:VWFA-related protein